MKRSQSFRNLPSFSIKAAVAELVAMALFVYIGTGTAVTFSSRADTTTGDFTRQSLVTNSTQAALQDINNRLQINSSWGIITALAFGLAITVLAYATTHLSGGQLNPAVTFALAAVDALPVPQAILNVASQVIGAILGSAFLAATIPSDDRGTLGSNQITPGISAWNALVGEIVMTFVLVSVVLETAINKKSVTRAQAPLAIGFSVFCGHAVMLPIDGCSINPARSLGPAIVSGTFPNTFWVFIIGPFIGALAAIPFHLFFRSDFDTLPSRIQDPVDLRAAESFVSADRCGGNASVAPSPEDEGNNNVARVNVGSQKVKSDGINLPPV